MEQVRTVFSHQVSAFAVSNFIMYKAELQQRVRFAASLRRSQEYNSHPVALWDDRPLLVIGSITLIVYGTLAGYIEDSPLGLNNVFSW
jgi:hypothetical protein